MDPVIVKLTESAYSSPDDVMNGLVALEQALFARLDRRAIFATAYINITRELQNRIQALHFHDSEWVSRYSISFANLYRQAFCDYEQGSRASVPDPWSISFETSQKEDGLVIQDLILAINAHVNHDLPLALIEVSIDPDRDLRRKDHMSVNAVLEAATDPVQSNISAMYTPVLGLLDAMLGRFDEELTNFGFKKAREHSWSSALALANARDEEERARVRESLCTQASVLAKLVLSPNEKHRILIRALQRLEKRTPWWKFLIPHLKSG